MGITRRPQTFSGLEESIADCCALLAAASPFHRELLLNLPEETRNRRKDWIDFVRLNADPLIDFKLAFDFPHAKLASSDKKIAVSYYQNKIKLGQLQSENNMELLLKVYLQNVSLGQAVAVFLSAPLEPFADVVVAGPNKLILVQCKSRSAKTSTNPDVDEELRKMGLPIKDDMLNDEQKKAFRGSQRYLEQLVKRSRVTRKEPIKIEAFVITAFNKEAAAAGSKKEKFRSGCVQVTKKAFGIDIGGIKKIGGESVDCKASVVTFQCDAPAFRQQCLFPAFPNVCTFWEVEPPSGHASLGLGL